MADFTDTFNRANASTLGNGWLYRARHEGQTTHYWRVVSNRARPYTDSDYSQLAYRSNPFAAGTAYQLVFEVVNAIGDGIAEVFFRHSAKGGLGNERLTVLVNGTVGVLQKQTWLAASGSETQVTLGTWARLSTNSFTLTIDVSEDDLITVYDSNFTGTDHKALEITDASFKTHVNVGMTRGWFNTVTFTDLGHGTSTDFDLGPVRARLVADLRVENSDPDPGVYPDAIQRLAGFSLSPYVVLDGIPQSATGIRTLGSGLAATSITMSDSELAPDPDDFTLSSDYRWLTSSPPVSQTWTPIQGGGGLTIHLSSLTDPKMNTGYKYTSSYGLLARPALCFKGGAYGQLQGFSGAPAQDEFTVALVGVLKNAVGPDYAVFGADVGDEVDPGLGTPWSVRYAHGKLQVVAGASYDHETYRNVGEPCIAMLSIGNDGIKVLLQDGTRTTKQIAVDGLSHSGRLFIGASMSVIDEFDANTAGAMDVLEINYWTQTLEWSEMLEAANLLSAIYGVRA